MPPSPFDAACSHAHNAFFDHPSTFTYVHVAPFLPELNEDDAPWERYVDIVRAKSKYGGLLGGLKADARGVWRFTAQEVLHICLLKTPPFQDEMPPFIKDVGGKQRTYPCVNHYELLSALSKALLTYECRCHAISGGARLIADSLLPKLGDVDFVVSFFLSLKTQEKLPGSQRLPRNTNTIRKAFDDIWATIFSIPEQAYQQLQDCTPGDVRTWLIEDCTQAFAAYGPQAPYPKGVTSRAIAAILHAFKIEESLKPRKGTKRKTSEIDAIADRQRQRQRYREQQL